MLNAMLIQILQDAFFAAIAAIGFAAISRPPRQTFVYCALLAAIGHSLRFVIMHHNILSIHIIPASFVAAFIVGILAVFLSPIARTPAETCLFPALLPMVPGIYAYKSFGALAKCLFGTSEQSFEHSFYLFASNGMTCFFILMGMVTG
ncbi:MAG: threonine/serine exporter family protein, partial [Muribaculaceae bacterium]|nr:threonine/serine exporter family protein [Muribaculaceae bacterium]